MHAKKGALTNALRTAIAQDAAITTPDIRHYLLPSKALC
jgi:hypothetical protein